MKIFILIALIVLIGGVAIAISRSDERAKDAGNDGFATYRHPQYGFSFDYPDGATLYDSTNDDELIARVEPPQLVRIVLPETYPNLKTKEASLNYLLEVSLADTDEPIESRISPETALATKDYRAEISNGENIFRIALDGIWPGGPEVPPGAREAFTIVRDSFEVTGKTQRP